VPSIGYGIGQDWQPGHEPPIQTPARCDVALHHIGDPACVDVSPLVESAFSTLGESTGPSHPSAPYPRVSVLVPARNEAASITLCVDSLLHQDYANSEIIVLNDQSTDGTGEKLDTMARSSPQLKVIHAADDLPAGWNGKSYACQRLAEQATGDWLLFTDADTEHMPGCIARGIDRASMLNVDLLSVSPYQRAESWSERLVVSFIVDFLPLIGLDFKAIWRGEGNQVAANGQCLLVRASSYRATGGHRAIASARVDDFALAKHFKMSGYRIAFLDGTDMLRCRMYHNKGEVWNGFLKNILLGLETSSLEQRPKWFALPFAWCYACLFVLPYFHLLFTRQRKLALLEIGWLAALRGITGFFLKRPPSEVLTTPAGALSVMALGLAALYRRWRGQKIAWKGRLYGN
jgi:chlorobactene glucosyltransferase